MNPYEVLCGSFWGFYCCCHIVIFGYDIINEQYNVTNKCKDFKQFIREKTKKRKGYERVELEIDEYEPEMMLPETGKDKMLYKSYKPMDTLYEINE